MCRNWQWKYGESFEQLRYCLLLTLTEEYIKWETILYRWRTDIIIESMQTGYVCDLAEPYIRSRSFRQNQPNMTVFADQADYSGQTLGTPFWKCANFLFVRHSKVVNLFRYFIQFGSKDIWRTKLPLIKSKSEF